ncbi:uncharacterized protein METZ01_LOCUS238351 [marine metagenome]|uniref:Uncharacterized protein n=1 Tax=marine metagenome TaxID=408172 RepID=A0A382HF38_9ZZZZ
MTVCKISNTFDAQIDTFSVLGVTKNYKVHTLLSY